MTRLPLVETTCCYCDCHFGPALTVADVGSSVPGWSPGAWIQNMGLETVVPLSPLWNLHIAHLCSMTTLAKVSCDKSDDPQ